MTENHFNELMKLDGKVEKKNGLNYISWANAWAEVKNKYPETTYKVYTNESGMPYFVDDSGGFVKVSVTVGGTEQMCWLPILDFRNNPMKKEAYTFEKFDKYKNQNIKVEVKAISSFDINKSIMRALTKAIAFAGYGLFVFAGEDLPEDSKGIAERCIPQKSSTGKTYDYSASKKPAEPQKTPKNESGDFNLVCIGCGAKVSQKVYDYSMNLHKMSLCFECQQKKKKGEDYLPKIKEEEVN